MIHLTNRIAQRVLIVLCLFIFAQNGNAEADIFDFNHIEYSIAYLRNPTIDNLTRIVESDGMDHLKNHSDRTGYYSKTKRKVEIARDIISQKYLASGDLDKVEELVAYVKREREKQKDCVSKFKEYLPSDLEFEGKLFFTMGYDIGVSMDKNASLNLSHKKFIANREEIWFYCIHELHHAGLQHFHQFPDLSSINDGKKLFELVKYLTFFEGTAVYASYEARKRHNSLQDGDYQALENKEQMRAFDEAYFATYERVKQIGNRALEDEDWELLNNLSDGDRLWYRVGAQMAQTIDKSLGRVRLNQLVESGHDRFFETYFDLVQSND